MITTNINTTPPNYEEEINGFYLTQLDRTYDEGVVLSNSSSIGCRPLAFAIKAGTKILIDGLSFEIYADAAQSAVEFFIVTTTLSESINKGAKITIDKENLFLQYQRKTEGTVGGMPITSESIGKLEFKSGVYSFPAVDPNYVKILPSDFMINDDASGPVITPAVFNDGTNTGVSVENTDQELIATINIPFGTTATDVSIWGSNTTKTVEVYEMNIAANGKGSTVGTGTTNGSAISIGTVDSTTVNYLMIKILVSSTNHRIWGGVVTLTQN